MQWDEKDPSVRPLGRAREVRPWVGVALQECQVPVIVSVVVSVIVRWWAAAKSFVLPRWSDFYFSRPHKSFRGPLRQWVIRLPARPKTRRR